jgi:hypothetical protein
MRTSPAAVLQQLQLLVLEGEQLVPLPFPQQVHLVMQQHDFEFSLQIDFVVVFRVHAVLLRLPVLRHQDDGRLDGGHIDKNRLSRMYG